MRHMVVENFVIGEIAFRLFIWGDNPGTNLDVRCQNQGVRDEEMQSGTNRVC